MLRMAAWNACRRPDPLRRRARIAVLSRPDSRNGEFSAALRADVTLGPQWVQASTRHPAGHVTCRPALPRLRTPAMLARVQRQGLAGARTFTGMEVDARYDQARRPKLWARPTSTGSRDAADELAAAP